jgi:hypothetical protein
MVIDKVCLGPPEFVVDISEDITLISSRAYTYPVGVEIYKRFKSGASVDGAMRVHMVEGLETPAQWITIKDINTVAPLPYLLIYSPSNADISIERAEETLRYLSQPDKSAQELTEHLGRKVHELTGVRFEGLRLQNTRSSKAITYDDIYVYGVKMPRSLTYAYIVEFYLEIIMRLENIVNGQLNKCLIVDTDTHNILPAVLKIFDYYRREHGIQFIINLYRAQRASCIPTTYGTAGDQILDMMLRDTLAEIDEPVDAEIIHGLYQVSTPHIKVAKNAFLIRKYKMRRPDGGDRTTAEGQA